ncbi:hypothetical protein Tco_1417547 [Tanacetum coccineum]
MIDYALWEVIENGATLPKTTTVEGVVTVMPITTTKEKAQRRLQLKGRSTLMTGILNEHQLKFNSIKDAKKLLQKLVSQLEILDEKLSQEDVNQKLLRSLSPKWNIHAVMWRKKANLDTMSMDDLYNNLKVYKPEVKGMSSSSSSTQDIALFLLQITTLAALMKQLILIMEFLLLALKLYGRDGFEMANGRVDYEGKKVEEGSNYTLIDFSSSSPKVSNDSICSKSCLETVKSLKSQNDQLLRDLKKSKLMVLGEITIRELRKKLNIVQKEKDGIQLNVDKFKHASKSLNKLIECQIFDNCKKCLGYENYNAVPLPYTENFMPPTPDLSFIGLYEFVNKTVVEKCKAMSSEKKPKVVRKKDDAPCIEEWLSNNEEKDVSQPKIKKNTIRPNIVKKEFVKSKQQEKTTRKTVKQVEQHRQNTHSLRGNQKN